MSKIVCTDKHIIISNDKLYCFESERAEPIALELLSHMKEVTKSGHVPVAVDCMVTSRCNQWIAVCIGKSLLLFNDYEFQRSASIDKSASRVLFFNKKKHILIADRSGGVSFYDYSESYLQRLPKTMGHNSMLTDALISSDDDFIITSDRDEKIRVSCYPNVYNIKSFCLGHEQFVSSISFLPSNKNVLVSASGDKMIKLWDYRNGIQLCSYKDNKIENSIVKAVCLSHKKSSLVIVQFHKSDELAILSVIGTNDNNLKIEHKAYITVPLIIDLASYSDTAFFLSSNNGCKLKLYPVSQETDNKISQEVQRASKYLTNITLIESLDNFKVMFKREFDNVQEYQARKKARTGSGSKITNECTERLNC